MGTVAASAASAAGSFWLFVVFRVHLCVVEVGSDHQEVCNTEPHGQEDDLREQAGPQGTHQVEHVAQKPDGDEANGNALSRLHSPLLNELWHE